MADYANHFESNMEFLREYLPEVSLAIHNRLPQQIAVLMSRSGHPTATYDGNLLHSKYDPVREAARFVEATDIRPGDKVVCYGFGLGYHVEALLEAVGPGGRCCVIEVNESLLTTAFIVRDLSRIMKSECFVLITGRDEIDVAGKCTVLLSDAGTAEDAAGTKVLVHPASFKFIPKGYETIQNIFEVMLMERSMPQVFRRQSIGNLLANVDEILSWPGIDEVMPGLKGQPVFLVSAGPSLDEALPHLKKYEKRAWIFCVDTALSALMSASIRPDLIMLVDPQDASIGHFEGNLGSSIPLLFIPTASAEVVQQHRGPKVVAIQSQHSIVSKVEHLLAPKGTVTAGGSTACIALGILVRYALSPIIFVGQDCGFPDMKVYSSNVLWTRRMLSSLNRFSTLEMKHRSVAKAQKLVTVKGKSGEQIPTHQNLYSYLRELERIISANPQVRFYNFFSKGAAIAGAQDLYFEEEVAAMLARDLDKTLDIAKGPVDGKVRDEIVRTFSGEN